MSNGAIVNPAPVPPSVPGINQPVIAPSDKTVISTTPITSGNATVELPAWATLGSATSSSTGPAEAQLAITVERAHPTIIGGDPAEEARQALAMGPTARLIEEKKPNEAVRQTIAHEIEAAFVAAARSGELRMAATIFLVAAHRPG